MTNKTIRIRVAGDDVIIDIMANGIEQTLSVTDPAKEIAATVNRSAKPEAKVKPAGRARIAKAKLVTEKKPGRGKGKRISQAEIEHIGFLRDEEKMTSKQIAEEMGISLATVNRHYRPLSSEREIQ